MNKGINQQMVITSFGSSLEEKHHTVPLEHALSVLRTPQMYVVNNQTSGIIHPVYDFAHELNRSDEWCGGV